jgi:hypothetical protein
VVTGEGGQAALGFIDSDRVFDPAQVYGKPE